MVSFLGVDSFAKSPENAFSIIVATILVNVLSSRLQLELNFTLLGFTFGFYLLYIFLLLAYLPKARNLNAPDQHRFNRHVFHAGLWIGISVPVVWSLFIPYPQPLYEQLPVSEWAALIQLKNFLPMLSFVAPLMLLLHCKKTTLLRVRMIDEFWKVLHEHSLEIIVGLIATFPFMTSVSTLGIRPLLPSAWLSDLIFVIVWAAFASWVPRREESRDT
jgi:hypothetical protein